MIQAFEMGDVFDDQRLELELGLKIDKSDLAEIVAGAPPELHRMAPYAALWGVSDDGYRSDLIAHARADARENLKEVVARYEDEFDAWLAGSEAIGPDFSRAYIAFTCLRMAADEA